MKGVDISHYQKGLTIRQIKNAGCDFAIMKLTEGSALVDNMAFGFYHEAYELGFPVGCYCYSHAVTPEQAGREAEFLLKTINGFPMPCGIFLDIEEPEQLALSHKTLIDMVLAWYDRIADAGYVPGVYGSESSLWVRINPKELPGDMLVWAARYGRSPDMPCDIWQSGDSGSVPGFKGAVDTDEARSERFRMLVKESFQPQQAAAGGRSDPIVMQMQACLRYAGYWQEKIDGIRSETFRERLCEYARGDAS